MVLNVITNKNLVRIITLNELGESINFSIDAAPNVNHSMISNITQNPIEDGSSITDHVNLEPRKVTINGLISETPLSISKAITNTAITAVAGQILPEFLQGSIVSLFQNSSDRVQDGYKVLKELWENKNPFSIQTNLELYENMIIQSLSIPETVERGLRFTMTLQQIKVVTTEFVRVPREKVSDIVEHTATSKQEEGKKTTQSIDGETNKKASSILKKIQGLF